MSDELILIEKNGEQIRVHLGTLENHKLLGWTVVESTVEEVPVDVVPIPEPEPSPAPLPVGKGKKGKP